MLRNHRHVWLPSSRRSVSALEFAIIAPVLITMMFGVWDISRALIVWQETYNAAQAVAQAGEKLSITAGSTLSTLTASQMQDAMTSVYAEIPGLNKGDGTGEFTGPYSVTLSSVTFLPLCTTATGCARQSPLLLWTSSLTEGGGQLATGYLRPCGTNALKIVSQFPSNSTTLASMADPDPDYKTTMNVAPQVVADVQYTYTPITTLYLLPVTFWASSAFPAPVGNTDQETTFNTTGGTSGVTVCQ
jgi:hypothetical protein